MSHAILSPSSASRWLACNPSARMEESFPDTTSEAAAEGTAAHALGEALLFRFEGAISESRLMKVIESPEVGPFYSETMLGYANDYATYVIEQFNTAKAHTSDAVLKIEQRLDITDYVPDGFGTGDAVIIADGVMDIIDLKYGKGVEVFAEDNKQMMLYALGALKEFDFMYAIQTVRMTVYQPRLDNISVWEMSKEELMKWAEDELKPSAQKAFKGEGQTVTGEHCRFCKAKAVCRGQYETNTKIATLEDPRFIDDSQISEILSNADAVIKWISAVKEYALREAIDSGKQFPDYKLVEGKSNRIYANQKTVADTLIENGYVEDNIYTKAILGITAMEKLLGKNMFNELLSEHLIKPQGKPTLVPLSDKRTEWNSIESAISDFSNIQL